MEPQIDVRDVILRIGRLDSKEKMHILNILKQTNQDFSKNANGYFFNLLQVPEHTLIKMVKCVELIETNRDLIKEMDRRRDELLTYYRGIIEETLLSSMKEKREKYISRLRLTPLPTNLGIEFTRVKKIKLRHEPDPNVDPDDLIKEYNKSRNKYDKDSVYQRLWTIMKSTRSKARRGGNDADTNSEIVSNDDDGYEGGEGEGEGEGEGGDGGEGYEQTRDESISESIHSGSKSDADSDSESDPLPDEYDKSIDHNDDANCVDDTESEITHTQTQTNTHNNKRRKGKEETKTETDTMGQDMNFYKKLLHQQGFKFRDKLQSLVREAYIN
jgi:hypothetical protein